MVDTLKVRVVGVSQRSNSMYLQRNYKKLPKSTLHYWPKRTALSFVGFYPMIYSAKGLLNSKHSLLLDCIFSCKRFEEEQNELALKDELFGGMLLRIS